MGGAGTPASGPASALGACSRASYGRSMRYTSHRSRRSRGSPPKPSSGSPSPSSSWASRTTTTRPPTRSTISRPGAPPTGSASPTTWRRWIEVADGQIVDAGYADDSHGSMGATTVRLGRATPPSPPWASTTSASPRSGSTGGMRFVQTVGGRTAVPAPRHVKRPPFVRLQAPRGVDHAGPHPASRRLGVVRGGRSVAVPTSLDLRRRRRPGRQGRAGRLQGLVPRRPGPPHALGRRGHPGAGHRGGDRARARAVRPRSCASGAKPRSFTLKPGALLTDPGRAGDGAVPAARRRAGGGGRRRAGGRGRSRARSWASGPCSKAADAPRPCGP